jgi:predicted DNA binding CopG/RHH family protein
MKSTDSSNCFSSGSIFMVGLLTQKATFKKDRRLNIRLSSKDLEAIQKRALAEGLPYQTLIASLLHKYASGCLKEV